MSSKRNLEDEDFSGEEEDEKVEKKAKTSSTESKTTKTKVVKGSGDIVFELGSKKKVTVGTFKGKVLVNVREFYEDRSTGEEKPGSKGIALNLDQWQALVEQFEEISAAVNARK